MQVKWKMLTEHIVQSELSEVIKNLQELAKEIWCHKRGKVKAEHYKGKQRKAHSWTLEMSS